MGIKYVDLTNKNKKISELSSGCVYMRGDKFFFRLDNDCHVKCILKEGSWIGDGIAEEFDSNEIVRVIQA